MGSSPTGSSSANGYPGSIASEHSFSSFSSHPHRLEPSEPSIKLSDGVATGKPLGDSGDTPNISPHRRGSHDDYDEKGDGGEVNERPPSHYHHPPAPPVAAGAVDGAAVGAGTTLQPQVEGGGRAVRGGPEVASSPAEAAGPTHAAVAAVVAAEAAAEAPPPPPEPLSPSTALGDTAGAAAAAAAAGATAVAPSTSPRHPDGVEVGSKTVPRRGTFKGLPRTGPMAGAGAAAGGLHTTRDHQMDSASSAESEGSAGRKSFPSSRRGSGAVPGGGLGRAAHMRRAISNNGKIPSQLRTTSRYSSTAMDEGSSSNSQRFMNKRSVSFADEHGNDLVETVYSSKLFYSKEGTTPPTASILSGGGIGCGGRCSIC